MMRKDNTKCELLAPAGGMDQLKAAVQNGADAIYLGGKLFNARINAGNFNMSEMEEAVRYAHLRDVKIYVTINILIKNEELQKAVEYVRDLYELGVDAIIVQDMGLAFLVKKYIPNMSLHLSTQGTVYNASGVKLAKKIGFKRVVLARELSIEEIKETTQIAEIEVFVHGALCICYSGQCQLSRIIGGRSGNRGECAQPCRLLYTNDKGEKGHWLSPKDLCGIERIPELIEAGVTSLKIEGRMKSVEYVAEVVRIYRKYIDKYYENNEIDVTEEDMELLQQVFSRGKFTEGYIDGKPKEPFLSTELSKHQGTYLGKVVDNRGGNNQLIDIKLSKYASLDMGDGVEIHSKKLTGNVVTYIEKQPNNILRIGDMRGSTRVGDEVYKISSKKQKTRAKRTIADNKKKNYVNMIFTAIVNNTPELIIWKDNIEISVKGAHIIEVANNSPIQEATVVKQLMKTGSTSFAINECSVFVDQVGAMSVSEINRMRREGLELLEKELTKKNEKIEIPRLEIEPFIINGKKVYGAIYPNITKGNADKEIKETLNRGKLEEKNIILNNLGWIEEFKKAGANVYGGYGLNIYNSESKKAFESLGIEVIEKSLENKNNISELMTFEYENIEKKFSDNKGHTYTVVPTDEGDKYKLILLNLLNN